MGTLVTEMKIDIWIGVQKEKYEAALVDYKNRLVVAIKAENPEGVERAATALEKTQWYLDHILPLIEELVPVTKKTKKK